MCRWINCIAETDLFLLYCTFQNRLQARIQVWSLSDILAVEWHPVDILLKWRQLQKVISMSNMQYIYIHGFVFVCYVLQIMQTKQKNYAIIMYHLYYTVVECD